MPHSVSTGSKAALVEGHQEADCTSARIITLGRSSGALALHKTGYLFVKLELGPVDLEVHGVRDTFREDFLGHPRAV